MRVANTGKSLNITCSVMIASWQTFSTPPALQTHAVTPETL